MGQLLGPDPGAANRWHCRPWPGTFSREPRRRGDGCWASHRLDSAKLLLGAGNKWPPEVRVLRPKWSSSFAFWFESRPSRLLAGAKDNELEPHLQITRPASAPID